MATNTDKLELVRQMLAKAEATDYPAEAEAFTAAAERLIMKHNLDRAEVDAKDEPEDVGRVTYTYVDRYGLAWVHLWHGVGKSLKTCEVSYRKYGSNRWEVTVYGTAEDVRLTKRLVESLIAQAKVAMKVWWAEFEDKPVVRSKVFMEKRSYYVGFALGASSRVEREMAEESTERQSTALVLVSRYERAKQEMERHTRRAKGRSHGATGSLGDGVADGRKAETSNRVQVG